MYSKMQTIANIGVEATDVRDTGKTRRMSRRVGEFESKENGERTQLSKELMRRPHNATGRIDCEALRP